MSGNILLSDAAGLPRAIPSTGDSMKSSFLYAGAALACALGLSACGGGDGDLPLTVSILGGVTKEGLVLVNTSNGDEVAVAPGVASVQFTKYLSTDDEFNISTKTLPSNVSGCTFSNNKARANYYTVYTSAPTVFCTIKTHPLAVTVNGLTGSGLVLVNGSDRRPVTPNNGAAVSVAVAEIPEDGPYGITILTQPDTQTCAISGGSGNMTATGPGTNPVVTCGPKT
jgi:LPXTG-motif cell wall-anchored protein